MLGRTSLFAAGAIGFALFVVSPSEEEEEEATSNNYASQSTNSDWYAGGHTLNRSSNGHFFANATIDGASVEMMVDTGASVIALTGSDASALGLSWDDSDVRHIGSGASGAVYGVPTRLSEVDIGGIAKRNVSAVIIPEGLDISLLGQSYLSQLGSVEIVDDQMVFNGK